jgi:deferrochelatase/peroxidase EfeB
MRWRATFPAAALIAALAGCGGGGGSPSAPNPTPGPQRTLIAEGSQGNILPASQGAAYFLIFTVPANASLEATVDWTSASNPVGIGWAQGDCRTDPNCSLLEENVGSAKPKTLRVSNLAAGNYTLIIVNFGTTNESISFQIFVVH